MNEKKRILIAEDDNVLSDVLSIKLEKKGYIVDKAEDGVIAMEKIRAVKPDCVLLDILMPRKNGIEVLEEIVGDPALRDIPVIIISNSGQPGEIQRAQELGAREFLIKAVFSPSEVLEKVERVLAGGKMAPRGEWGVRTQNVVGGSVRDTEKQPSPVAQEKVVSATNTTGEKIFVLVVEDDKFLRELLVRKLGSEGFDVKNATDAQAAFAILGERKPNLIILDILLPGIDGFEILKRIKADPKIMDIPIIILSNLGQKEDTDKAMTLGAADFMIKANFTLDEIVAKVRLFVK